jgi:CHRD domain
MIIKTSGVTNSIASAIILASLMVTATTYGLTNTLFAQSEMKIVINLTGDEEVPPVQTDAKGIAEISPGGADSIGYTINATNIQDVTAGHVHLGAKGENGPIVVTLFKYDNPMNEVSENGTITADKLEGPMAGKQISDLAAAGANGTLYVNIHTEKNPNGEIRGQGGNPLAGQ